MTTIPDEEGNLNVILSIAQLVVAVVAIIVTTVSITITWTSGAAQLKNNLIYEDIKKLVEIAEYSSKGFEQAMAYGTDESQSSVQGESEGLPRDEDDIDWNYKKELDKPESFSAKLLDKFIID